MTNRDSLLNTTRDILWEKGYEAMSPRMVLEQSGVGHGSLYHHFPRKEDLAFEAMQLVADELLEKCQQVLGGPEPSLDKLKTFLRLRRSPLKGCRIGRLVNESSIPDSKVVQPIQRYFTQLKKMLVQVLSEGMMAGELPKQCDCDTVAELIIATIQGAYVSAKARQDTGAMRKSLNGLVHYLELLQKS